jgi:peptidyl-prolyl cis-trans isomerase SurA
VIITINDKTYGKKKVTFTQEDFTNYLTLNMRRNAKEMAIPMLVDKEFKSFVDDMVMDYEKSILSLKHADYKALVTEYHDGILLFEIMEKKIWRKAMSDTLGLDSFFVSRQSEYMWKERLDADIFICKSQSVATELESLMSQENSDSLILVKLNKDSELNVNVHSGKFEEGGDAYLDKVEWKKGVSSVKDGNSVVVIRINEVIPSQAKELKEVKGLVTSAYQDELDKLWIKELRSKYNFTLNQEVLTGIAQ